MRLVMVTDDEKIELEAPEGTTVWRPDPEFFELLESEEIDLAEETLKIPDGQGGFTRLPRTLAIEAARRGELGLRFVGVCHD